MGLVGLGITLTLIKRRKGDHGFIRAIYVYCCSWPFYNSVLQITVSKWPSESFGHFKTSFGFKMAWPFQNLSGQS